MKPNVFFTFDEFKNLYPAFTNTNFLMYSGIIRAVQHYLAKLSITTDDVCRVLSAKPWNIICKGSKIIKNTFLKSDIVPTAVARWNDLFERLNWEDIFSRSFKFNDVKLKWFQVRVIHRLIPTRKFLYDRKIVDDPLCSFCDQEIQTIQHLFWSCDRLKDFWNEFEGLIELCYHSHIFHFTEELVLFGCKDNVVTDDVFDFLLVLAKYYIYICYRNNRIPNMVAFLAIVRSRYVDMELLARINGTYHDFTVNWSLYQPLLL